MGLLASSGAVLSAPGGDFLDDRDTGQGRWLSFGLVALVHLVGIYALATWVPRSEWLKLWKPVEVRIVQERRPVELPVPEPVVEQKKVEEKKVEVKREPIPQPLPKVVERIPESPPPVPAPKERQVDQPPPAPAPVITAAPSAPAATEASTFVVPPQPPAPPPSPPVVAQPTPAASGPRTVSKAEFVRAPDPAYPMMSRRLGEEGKVLIRVLVNEKGHAVEASVHQSSGRPRLDEAARKAVMDALFKPYREDGKAEQVYVVVPVIFKMQG